MVQERWSKFLNCCVHIDRKSNSSSTSCMVAGGKQASSTTLHLWLKQQAAAEMRKVRRQSVDKRCKLRLRSLKSARVEDLCLAGTDTVDRHLLQGAGVENLRLAGTDVVDGHLLQSAGVEDLRPAGSDSVD